MTLTPAQQRVLEARTAPGWRPTPGSVITGEIVGITRMESESGYGAYPRIVLDLGPATGPGELGGMVAVHAFHATLKAALAELHAAGQLGVGDTITVAYAGRRKTNDGQRDYELYTVLAGDGTSTDDTLSAEHVGELLG